MQKNSVRYEMERKLWWDSILSGFTEAGKCVWVGIMRIMIVIYIIEYMKQ